MALRVLLADESSTIKKVFQLALQDYAVDVCAVSLGLDVLPVARQFKPDIVFCDVLLQKKSGYEVCAELKNDAQFKTVPVVLMWSSFMELDEDKLQAARSDGHLEKPFDVKDLRKIINDLVPRTRGQKLGGFLTFPKMPEIDAGGGMVAAPEPSPGNWNMENFDPIPAANQADPDALEGFEEVPLPPPPKMDQLGPAEDAELEKEATQWSAKPLGRFQVDDRSQDEINVQLNEDVAEISPDPELEIERPAARAAKTMPQPQTAPQIQLSQAELQKLVHDQARAIIESIAWKVVPDLATQIIERELKRLLSEKGSPPAP
jgi:CheY-like chemotaxis protein